MDNKENKLPTNLENVEQDLQRPNQPGDRLAPSVSWKNCYDLIYLSIYRLFYPNIPTDQRELSAEEVDKRIDDLKKEKSDGRLGS